jgi:hypothetical protein
VVATKSAEPERVRDTGTEPETDLALAPTYCPELPSVPATR